MKKLTKKQLECLNTICNDFTFVENTLEPVRYIYCTLDGERFKLYFKILQNTCVLCGIEKCTKPGCIGGGEPLECPEDIKMKLINLQSMEIKLGKVIHKQYLKEAIITKNIEEINELLSNDDLF